MNNLSNKDIELHPGQIVNFIEMYAQRGDKTFILGSLDMQSAGKELHSNIGMFIEYITPTETGMTIDNKHYTPKCIVMSNDIIGWCYVTDFVILDM